MVTRWKHPLNCNLSPPPVMTPWCREQIPVEGNFGQLFDQLNASIDQLSGEFSAGVIVQVVTLLHLPRPQMPPAGRWWNDVCCVTSCRNSSSRRCWTRTSARRWGRRCGS